MPSTLPGNFTYPLHQHRLLLNQTAQAVNIPHTNHSRIANMQHHTAQPDFEKHESLLPRKLLGMYTTITPLLHSTLRYATLRSVPYIGPAQPNTILSCTTSVDRRTHMAYPPLVHAPTPSFRKIHQVHGMRGRCASPSKTAVYM